MYMFRLFSAVFVLLAFIVPNQSFAQEQGGLSLTPPLIEESADPGEVLTSVITVSNLSSERQTYFLFPRDIEGVADNGRPLFVNDTFVTTDLNLSSWIALTQGQVTLEPGAEVDIPLLITVPENAPPGGHFAGIFASRNAPTVDAEGVGAGVGFRVGNIVNIRVTGDVTEEAYVRSLQTDSFIYGDKNVTFTARVENTGNVLVRPTGPLNITNMMGDQVATLAMNNDRVGVFPGSIRAIDETWEEAGLGFGRYTAELAMVYGVPGEAQYTITGNTSFWILPWEIIQPLLIALGILALASYVLVRYYIQQQVRKLAGGRRLVRSTQVAGPSPLILAAIVMLFVTALVLFILLLLFA